MVLSFLGGYGMGMGTEGRDGGGQESKRLSP